MILPQLLFHSRVVRGRAVVHHRSQPRHKQSNSVGSPGLRSFSDKAECQLGKASFLSSRENRPRGALDVHSLIRIVIGMHSSFAPFRGTSA